MFPFISSGPWYLTEHDYRKRGIHTAGGCGASLKPEAHSSTSLAGCTFLSLTPLSLQSSHWPCFLLFHKPLWLYFFLLLLFFFRNRGVYEEISPILFYISFYRAAFFMVAQCVESCLKLLHSQNVLREMFCQSLALYMFPPFAQQSGLMTFKSMPFCFISPQSSSSR